MGLLLAKCHLYPYPGSGIGHAGMCLWPCIRVRIGGYQKQQTGISRSIRRTPLNSPEDKKNVAMISITKCSLTNITQHDMRCTVAYLFYSVAQCGVPEDPGVMDRPGQLSRLLHSLHTYCPCRHYASNNEYLLV